MNKSTIQVPIDNNLRISAENTASSLGFSSLQEIIRVFIAQLATKTITINFISSTPDEVLTPKQAAVLTKQLLLAKKGPLKTAHSAQELIDKIYNAN
jgi:antitoxin component of RelBE/YafQ-DinJ toxin-antitoxin module